MIAGNSEEIALRITGTDAGASAAVRGVGAALTDTSRVSVEASKRMAAASKEVTTATAMSDAEIKKSAASLALYGRTVDVTNKSAVAAFRESAEAERELLVETKANEDALNRLSLITQQFEKRVDSAAQAEAKLAASSTAAAEAALAQAAAASDAAQRQAQAMGKVEAAAYAENAAREKANNQVAKIAPQARSAANGLTVLALAASTGGGSLQSMALAGGLAGSSLLSMSSNAKLAASANGIGALITALGVAIGYYQTLASEQGKVSQGFTESLNFTRFNDAAGNMDKATYARVRAGLEARRDAAQKTLDEITSKPIYAQTFNDLGAQKQAFRDIVNYTEELSQLDAKRVGALSAQSAKVEGLVFQHRLEAEAMHRESNDSRETLHYATLQADLIAGGGNAIAQRYNALQEENRLAREQVKSRYELRDEYGRLRPLSAQQSADLAAQLKAQDDLTAAKRRQLFFDEAITRDAFLRQTAEINAQGGTVADRYAVALAAIQAEEEADIRAGRTREEVEARAQAKIRALRKATKDQALADAGTLTGVLEASGSRQVRAIGHAADSVRRILIGAQAAHAAVESAIEGGKAIGSLASGDFRGAALHGASALELAKAAALGAQESLGGGRVAAGGGGGGAGATGADSFTPRNQGAGGGDIHITLLSQSQLTPGQIDEVRFKLNRADVLDKPMQYTAPGGSLTVRAG